MKELSRMAQNIAPSATLAIGAKAKELISQGINIISFTVGEPDFNTPEHIRNAAKKALDDGFTKYTATSGIIELKKAICNKLKNDNNIEYQPQNIVVSTGAKQALLNSLMAILNPGDEVIVLKPYWVSYPEMIKIAGGIPVFVDSCPENEFKVAINDIQKAITNKTKAIMFNSPCNPSGAVYTADEIRLLAEVVVKNDIYIIADEIYEKLIYDEGYEHFSIASLNEEIKDRTIVINGVSKTYSMTGFRIGYSAAPENISKLIANIQSHATSNPNSIAQKAALTAISGSQELAETMKKAFKDRRDYMVQRISSMEGVTCVRPHGAFYVMMDMSNIYGKTYKGNVLNEALFAKILLEEFNVAVVPCSSFGEPNFIRLSYAMSMEDIKEGLDRIEKFIKEILK